MTWIKVQDELPELNQEVLIIDDKREIPQLLWLHQAYRRDAYYVPRRIFHGWVSEVNHKNLDDEDNGNHENWIECRASKSYNSVTGMVGSADCITHWMPMPDLPPDTYKGENE